MRTPNYKVPRIFENSHFYLKAQMTLERKGLVPLDYEFL